MTKRWIAMGLLATLALFICSCAAPPGAGGVRPWTDRPVLDGADRFHFAIIGDITGEERPGVFETALAKINLLQPAFVMSIGDLIEGYTQDPAEVRRQRESFMQKLAELDMRFHFVAGNHDITNDMMAEEWRIAYGPSYYHFVYRDVLFLCLNTEDPSRTRISHEQARRTAQVLAEHPDVRWTFVFMHQPLWLEDRDGAGTGWERVAEALEGRPHTVFAGHYHRYIHCERNGQDYIVLATTGGGSDLRGLSMGEFDHIAWVTMTTEGPVIANLRLDGILPKNVVPEEVAAANRALRRADYLKSDGIASAEQSFRRGAGTLTLSNNHPYPVAVRGKFVEHACLVAEPVAFSEDLAPGAVRHVPITVTMEQPLDLTELEPLLLELSATYRPPGYEPLTFSSEYVLAVHGTREGAEVLVNGAFDGSGEPWLAWVDSRESGQISVASGAVTIALREPKFWWSAGVRQFVEGMRGGGRYRVTLRAANKGGRGRIYFELRGGEEQAVVPLLLEGRRAGQALIAVTETMESHVMEFTVPRDLDLSKAKVTLGLGEVREGRIDDISLREIVGGPPGQ